MSNKHRARNDFAVVKVGSTVDVFKRIFITTLEFLVSY